MQRDDNLLNNLNSLKHANALQNDIFMVELHWSLAEIGCSTSISFQPNEEDIYVKCSFVINKVTVTCSENTLNDS